jgi:hypothetical protein
MRDCARGGVIGFSFVAFPIGKGHVHYGCRASTRSPRKSIGRSLPPTGLRRKYLTLRLASEGIRCGGTCIQPADLSTARLRRCGRDDDISGVDICDIPHPCFAQDRAPVVVVVRVECRSQSEVGCRLRRTRVCCRFCIRSLVRLPTRSTRRRSRGTKSGRFHMRLARRQPRIIFSTRSMEALFIAGDSKLNFNPITGSIDLARRAGVDHVRRITLKTAENR